MRSIFKGIVLLSFVIICLFSASRIQIHASECGPKVLSLPLQGRITQEYGCLHDYFARISYPSCDKGQGGFHSGLDIAASCGTAIKAPADGMIVASGNLMNSSYGRWMAVMHNSIIGIFSFTSDGRGFSSQKRVYTSGSFNFEKTKIESGDVNGDGKEDLVALYNYGNNKTGIWVFTKTNTGYTSKRWWLSNPGVWSWSGSNLQIGDVNNDGKDDIILVYRYNTTKTGIWNFISNGKGFSSINRVFTHNSFSYSRAKFAQGDVTGDGKDDIIALYNYGSGKAAMIVFEKTRTSYGAKIWKRLSVWNWYNSTLKVGDIDKDSIDDAVVVYGYPSKINIWDFVSTGTSFASGKMTYSVSLSYNKSKFAFGDVTGDGKDDLIALYNYGNNTTGFWIFKKTDTGYFAQRWWKSLARKWNFEITNLRVGDLNNDNIDDIIPVYGYGSLYTLYAHLSSFNASGAVVERQSIAKVGNTGYSTGCHLHFMTGTSFLKINGNPVIGHQNPRCYLK